MPVNTTWWVQLAWVDVWGATDLNFSGEFEATAERITETEITENSISTPLLKANAVTAEKIAADTITGNEISSATTITAGTGENTAGMNGTGSDTRFWSGSEFDVSVDEANFHVDTVGNLRSVNATMTGASNDGGILTAGTINSSVVSSTDVTASSIHGGTINGTEITGVTIIGSTIISSEELYTADPYGDGTITYYEGHDDVPVTCSESISEYSVSNSDAPGKTWNYFELPTFPASVNTPPITNNRLRWLDVPVENDFFVDINAARGSSSNNRVRFQIVSVEDGEVLSSAEYPVADFDSTKTVFGMSVRNTYTDDERVHTQIIGGTLGATNNPDINGRLRVGYFRDVDFTYLLRFEVSAVDNGVRP